VVKSLPAVISSPGSWCLNRSLFTNINDGRAIEIKADNVTLDGRGFELNGEAGGPYTDAIGIASWNYKNTTVRNIRVVGFDEGLSIGNTGDANLSRGHLLEKIRVDRSRTIGIRLFAEDSTIRKCTVNDTVGVYGFSAGIAQKGANTSITDNQVFDTRSAYSGGNASASGIDLFDNAPRTVTGNRVDRVSGAHFNYGIHCGKPFEHDNRVRRADIPFSTCDAYPYPYPDPYPYPRPNHGPVHASTRYGMALVGGLMACLAMLKRMGIA